MYHRDFLNSVFFGMEGKASPYQQKSECHSEDYRDEESANRSFALLRMTRGLV
jgi:hypothetical protein